MREAFVHATQRGEHTTGWRLRIGSVEQLADDTKRVLGYRPKNIDSFLGLPIEVRPYGTLNELVTSAGNITMLSAASLESVDR